MRDVNGSSFSLLAGPADWSSSVAMTWHDSCYSLAGRQSWRLPKATRADARARLAATKPVVVDAFGGIARIRADGLTVECLDGTNWTPLTDIDGAVLAPKVGSFVAMTLAGARLALICQQTSASVTTSYLEMFDLRGRWPLDGEGNPSLPLALDPFAAVMASAPNGPILIGLVGGLAIFEGGPAEPLFAPQAGVFAPLTPNPDALRQTALLDAPALAHDPAGGPVAIAANAATIAVLLDQNAGPLQTLALLDRLTGAWTSLAVTAADGTPLPYFTDLAWLEEGLIALMAPPGSSGPSAPLDCAVMSWSPTGLALAPRRYPMLDQYAPRFAAIAGPPLYLGIGASGAPAPRRLVALPYPGYVAKGALARFALTADDPDVVWHRLYAEAYLPQGTALSIWARASGSPIGAADQAAMTNILLNADPSAGCVGPSEAATIAVAAGLGAPSAALATALNVAPFHRQPPLQQNSQPSELPFHPGLAALAGAPGALYEMLLQRSRGANRRLTGIYLDVVAIASGDGRHSPCLRALRIHATRFCYQDQYLPALFHQTAIANDFDGADMAAASPPDFRERLLANLEGLLTPIENRVAAAEYLLDPDAAPSFALPWLFSYFGRTPDPSWPEARSRRALANLGRQLRQRGTYRGVCLALDIATDGAVARGEVVVVETFRLRRTDATVLGMAMSGRNVLTGDGIASGNSIVGDTLTLSAERTQDLLRLLAPATASIADPAAAAQFLDQYADRFQVAVLLQGPAAASLRAQVTATLQAELPAHLAFDIVLTDQRFVLGLSPLLDVDSFLDPLPAPAPLTLDQSAIGRDAIVRNPAALRQ